MKLTTTLEAALKERYQSCELCVRRCAVDRHASADGYCGLGTRAHVYKELLHVGEEETIVPCHTIFATGCSLRCAFCSDGTWVDTPELSDALPYNEVRSAIFRRAGAGAKTLGLVGGEPVVNLLGFVRILKGLPAFVRNGLPLVLNTNGLATEDTLDLVEELVDVHVVDFKFGADTCAQRLADMDVYVEHLLRTLRWLQAHGAPTIVRHLVLPGHLDCCTTPVLLATRDLYPTAWVNLMLGYVPHHRHREAAELGAMLTADEREAASALVMDLGFENVMIDGLLVRQDGQTRG